MLTRNAAAHDADTIETSASEVVWRQRELDVAAEIAHVFLAARHPLEIYRHALARVTPLVGARFASVYLRDAADPSLLRVHCAHNWPQDSAPFLGQFRLRESAGPSGLAAATNEAVEVSDIFADATLHEWWEPARELGFASIVSLPLRADRTLPATTSDSAHVIERQTLGVLTLYFAKPTTLDTDDRRLLSIVADQLAAATAKAWLIDEVKRTNDELNATNAELRRRLGEFETARRIRDEFLATVNHEFRTPLTAILGYADLLDSGPFGDLNVKQAEAVERIRKAAHELLRFFVDLMDLSQLRLGQLRVARRAEDGVSLARRAAEAADAPPERVRLAIEATDAGIIVSTDGDRVVGVLEKLLRNAYTFTTEGAVMLRVAQCERGGVPAIEWSVAHTGNGIAREHHEASFDPFRQADPSSARPYDGTGVGLSVARGFARLLGGEITLDGEAGAGATFRFTLPLNATQQP